MTGDPRHAEASGASLLAGVIVGAAIGSLWALLYAPKRGKELRADVCRRLDEMRDYVDQTARQLAETARTKLAEVQSDLTEAVEGVRATVAETQDDLTRRMHADAE